MGKYYFVKEIWQIDDKTLGIAWTDRRESRLNVVELREKCPCAGCKDGREHNHFTVSKDVRPKVIKSVGRHAISIEFSDGHRTGYFTFEMLRNLG